MIWLPLLADALAGAVTLRAAVHRDAGTVHDIAADGAAGQCTVTVEALHCPADGPVTFRWGRGGEASLTGATILAPGETGVAFVLATEEARTAERGHLAADAVTADVVRDLFVRTGDHPVPMPSPGMLEDLFALSRHPDPLVRRELVDALLPYWRHTASDPFPPGSPPVVPDGLLTALSADPDVGVRRRLASRLRDLREPGEPLAEEATQVLLALASQGGGVQRAAFASLAVRGREGDPSEPASEVERAAVLEAWDAALAGVATPGPPGRAAAKMLVTLASVVDPADVDPAEAVHRTAAIHLERTWSVWNAWREHVPFERTLAERLVRETIGFSPALIRHWGAVAAPDLVDLLARWEPRAPHSDRYVAMVRSLRTIEDPALDVLRADDNLSPEAPPPPGP